MMETIAKMYRALYIYIKAVISRPTVQIALNSNITRPKPIDVEIIDPTSIPQIDIRIHWPVVETRHFWRRCA